MIVYKVKPIGASSSALSRSCVERLEKLRGRPLARLSRSVKVRSFNSKESQDMEVVVTSLTHGEIFTVARAPFLLSDHHNNSDGLIGMMQIMNRLPVNLSIYFRNEPCKRDPIITVYPS